MANKIRMSQAIEDFLLFRRSQQKSTSTIRNDRMILRRLFLVTGDIYVSSLGDRHVNTTMALGSETRSAASLGIDHATLSKFCEWAVRNRYLHQLDNPMHGRKAPKSMPIERRRLPMKDFDRLLDAAGERDPRDRMVVALGLYLFLRGGEAADLRVGDVLPRLDQEEVAVRVFKTKQIDIMAISEELDTELRRWLTYYTEQCGPLQPEWFLVPARTNLLDRDLVTGRLLPGGGRLGLRPDHKISKIEQIVQQALEKVGFPTRDSNGGSLREGMHTLRRSGARALFDTQRELGYDGAIRHVQAMLHHANMSMTEHYLGLTLDRVKRNELIKGKRMFPTGGHNVVQMREAMTADGQG
jgi:integrase